MEELKQQPEMKLLAEVPHGTRQTIRLHRKTYKGSDFYDLRLFWTNDAGETVPTRRGISHRIDEPDKVRTILDAWETDVNQRESKPNRGSD